jgi:MFS transporter, DHA1 family, inner membrane transport protein
LKAARDWPWRVLLLAALVGMLVDFDGTVLYLGLSQIAADFHAQVSQLTQAISLLALGSVLALPLGTLADRRGRRFTLVIVTAGFAAGNVLSGLAPSLLWLAVARLIAVCFASAAFALALTIVIEASPPAHRSLLVTAVSFGSGAGAGITAILYPLLAPHWRYLYLLGGLGFLLAAALWRWLPESRIWAEATRTPSEPPGRLLLRRQWRGRLAIVALSGALSFVAFEPGGLFGAFFATRDLHFSPFLVSAVLFTSAPLAVPGYLLGGWLSDRSGRRVPGTVFWALSAVFAAITYSGSAATFWAGNATWTFLDGAASPITSAWFGELFPTRARATSQAVATVAAAFGGVAGLQLVGRIEPGFGLGHSLVVVCVAALIGALVLLALPETAGNPLPE